MVYKDIEKKKANQRRFYRIHRDEILEKQRRSHALNPEKYNKVRREWYNKTKSKRLPKLREYSKNYRRLHKDSVNKYARYKAKEYRTKLLEKVGRGKTQCNRCGCDIIEFLEVNHKNGGGQKDLATNPSKFTFDVIFGRRSIHDLEILCRPCNAIHYLEQKSKQNVPLKVFFNS